MFKKKICFIAQFPPPMHGLSKAVDTLYNSCLSTEFEFEKVDITNNKSFFKNLILLFKSKADLFYFTISQTKGGNVRDLIILKLLKIQNKKCVIHLHGGYYRKLVNNDIGSFQRKLNYKSIKNLEGTIVLSNSLKDIFEGMIRKDKIYVVPNCVDDEFLMNEAEFKEKIAELNHKKILDVLYLSNFIKSKGYPEVLEMAKIEKERVMAGEQQRFHFNFAGKFFLESEKEYFYRYVKDNNLEQYVTYHGVVGGVIKKELLKKCNIFILLTRYPKEGQPISILEAMGNGLAIVTSDHAGIPDIVKNEVNGIVSTFTEQKDVLTLYNSMKCDEGIMINNRSVVLEEYMEERYIHDLYRIFKKI